jgi:mono/diheme cytochrome c family protein
MMQNRLKYNIIVSALVLTALTVTPVQAQNFGRGQELYEDHCQACHEDLMHEKNRKLKSLTELRDRVQAWATHTGNPWTREEVDDVLYYLNKSFYRFDQKAL